MSRFLSRIGFTYLGLLLACSGGDLTLPGPNEPAAPTPASLRIASGNSQRANPGAPLGQPLRVQVLDDGGQPLAGVAVQFSFLKSCPTPDSTHHPGRLMRKDMRPRSRGSGRFRANS
jgi:hypothetical protein